MADLVGLDGKLEYPLLYMDEGLAGGYCSTVIGADVSI